MKVFLILSLFFFSSRLYAQKIMTEFSAVIGETTLSILEEKDRTTIKTLMSVEVIKLDKCSEPHLKSFWMSFQTYLRRKNMPQVNGLPPLVYKYRLNGKEYSTHNKTRWGAYLEKLPRKANLLVSVVRRVCKK